MTGRRTSFEAALGFPPDEFQAEAMDALDAGRSVLVAAPTGAGKTVVGEYACHAALVDGGRCVYTTPIKALSNQKLRDLAATYGEQRVGLMTGDRTVNPDAPVVVMTTEVLRNMIYAGSSTVDELRAVVLDEVHYLADRSRGAVWEEVITQLPRRVQVVALSATVSNAEEFGAWLDEARGGCEIIVEEHRPVPLEHHYYVNDTVYPTFRASKEGGRNRGDDQQRARQALGGVPNPEVLMLERRAGQRHRVNKRGRRQADVRLRWPDRVTVVDELRDRGWLPAIVFVFSRRGCDDAVQQLVRAGVRLTTPQEATEIAALCDTLLADVPQEDLDLLGHASFRSALMDGVAPHHAGMVPLFKEVVEECFQRGLLKVVVATETLALGINMPARTVVIERLEKWNGETHQLLTPGQYTQLTGRAGRRGIDRIGHAVVTYQRDLDFRTVAGLVGTRTYPLSSSFAPSYNMAVNLLRHHSLEEARQLLRASFAQFQADRSVDQLSDRLAEVEDGLAGYAGHLRCDEGDWAEYWALRRELSRREKAEAKQRRRRGREAVEDGIQSLRPGDVVVVPGVGRTGLVAVVEVRRTKAGTPLAQVVTDRRSQQKLGPRELSGPPRVVERVRVPNRGNVRQASFRADLADQLRAVHVPEPLDDGEGVPVAAGSGPSDEVVALRDSLRAHACHHCEDRPEHERWQRRADGLEDEAQQIRTRIQRRTGSLVRDLDRILRVLEQLDYVDATPAPTEHGQVLAGIHGDLDLLVAEAVRRGLLDDLSAPELAAVVSCVVYEARTDHPPEPWWPTAEVLDAVEDLEDLADELRGAEQRAGVERMRELDPGFVGAAFLWATGGTLDDAVGDLDMTGGDFVRTVKQVVDLLGQLRNVGGEDLRAAATVALERLRRGIVDA